MSARHLERSVLALPIVLLVLAAAALTGCSLLRPQFKTPRLAIVNVAIERSDFVTQHLRVRMRVDNPNDRALPVKGLEYSLYIEGDEAAHGISDAAFTVPALGEAEFDMSVTANMAGTLLHLLGRGAEARDHIDYRIAGKVELSRGLLRSIPFEQSGAFSLR
jgi:LEA14-like dessication related protein